MLGRRFWPLTALLLLAACMHAGPGDASRCVPEAAIPSPLFDLPLVDRKDGASPLVQAEIDGISGMWNIDTAATSHIVFLDDAAWQKVGAHAPLSFLHKASVPYPRPASLRLGDQIFPQSDRIEAAHPNISSSVVRDIIGAYKGSLAPQAIDPSLVTIVDMPRRRFVGFKGTIAQAEQWLICAKKRNVTFKTLTLDPRNRALLAPATLDGAQGLFYLSTGDAYSWARDDRIPPRYLRVKGLPSYNSFSGRTKDSPAVEDVPVEIGTFHTVVPILNLIKEGGEDYVDGVLGIDILKNAVLIVPWHERREIAIGAEEGSP
ncbi:MAG TPA: hypothetical protein VHL08_01795 [Dongiaceae bacterium]|nr:hypothetical protein [Dongiaceae bacterium]